MICQPVMNKKQTHSTSGSTADALGRWPRRLLYIPTMTSYQWKPGNIYGQHTAPEYNAITYTWGRWRLKHNERPDVRPISVSGIPWEIPRVSPSRFTANELERTIQMATGGFSTVNASREKELPKVDFIWIDIVCIDQRENNPTSASEIGRQALIFDGAKHVVAWLSTFSLQDLNNVVGGLWDKTDQIEQQVEVNGTLGDNQSVLLLGEIHDLLSKVFSDTWFTSLWTLQEAFLRVDALLMSREGYVPASILWGGIRPLSQVKVHADLFDITGPCEQMISDLVEKAHPPPDVYRSIRYQIQKSGLQALVEVSALSAYIAAGHRQFSRPEDAIYGIQQVFGARVGTTAPSANPRQSWSPDQLEIQLGHHILRRHPVLSQLHNFTQPAALGRAWLVSRTKSLIPSNQRFGSFLNTTAAKDHDPASPIETPKSALSIKRIGGETWGYFDGPYCSFVEFHKTFTELSKHHVLIPRLVDENLVTAYLDVAPELSKCPQYNSSGYTAVPRGDRQTKLLLWLSKHFRADQLGVLLLGQRGERGVNDPTIFAGLLLLRCRGAETQAPLTYHRRLGFCVWNIGHLTVGGEYLPNGKLMTGIAPLWKKTRGAFG
ncbi:hypothetical protein F4782DRAFT_506653 [Xylaria castorea]|nr:hypothetical protein F4782DRAFT_506653 [Xylaria castorea]